MRILVLNGPNLNLLGTREPGVYGTATLAEVMARTAEVAAAWGVELETFQSNHEGELIDRLHESSGIDSVVFNPGAFTHYSYALHDAVVAVGLPTVEVHLSNVKEREPWRRRSVIEPACIGAIYGRGRRGYSDAIRLLVERARLPFETLRYGPHRDQSGELRVPDGVGPHPVAVLFHGGFWRHMWTRDLMEAAAVDLTGRGWATWNVEYRRLGMGGGWPTTLEDAAAAVDHVSVLAADQPLDLTSVMLIGHSAGGHLALWCAARSRLESGSPGAHPEVEPSRVLTLAAIADLTAAYELGVGDGSVEALLRRSPPHQRYEVADPALLGPWSVPTTLLHSSDDPVVPASLSASFAEQVGGPVDLVAVPGEGHLDMTEPSGDVWKALITSL